MNEFDRIRYFESAMFFACPPPTTVYHLDEYHQSYMSGKCPEHLKLNTYFLRVYRSSLGSTYSMFARLTICSATELLYSARTHDRLTEHNFSISDTADLICLFP